MTHEFRQTVTITLEQKKDGTLLIESSPSEVLAELSAKMNEYASKTEIDLTLKLITWKSIPSEEELPKSGKPSSRQKSKS